MAYKFREEIVGKRFLSVSGFSKLKVNKISEWGWRAGVIRAASHRDNLCSELQVLVEYDDVEWQRREWLSPHKDSVFSFFLIEKGLSWADRPDPKQANLLSIDHNSGNNNQNQPRVNGKTLRGSAVPNVVSWPAVTFYPILARAEIPENSWPLEFMQDRHLDFVDYAKTKPFTADWDLAKGSSAWGSAVRRWAEMQDGQSILLTTPSILVGFRVEVYRAEGTTQWYTAVIVGYNEATKDLTVTDDTVLEDHSEDPRLVQMRLIGDGVVESIMRGEVVGMTPRRSRSSTGLAHTLGMSRKGRRPRGRPVSVAHLQTTLRSQSIAAQQIEKENRRLLEDLEVTTDGEIMEKEEVVTGTPILERRKLERKEKNMISALQESAVRNLNREILEEGSLFDENLSAEENENDDEKHSNYTDDDVGTSVNKKKGTSPATSVISLNDEAPRRDDPLVPTKTNGPDDFPNVTERNIEFLESLLHPENASFIEKFVNYAKKQRSIDEAETGTYSRTSREQMEIGRNSNIWLPSFEVESIKRRFKRHPAKMMRALLIELLGEDKLSKLSISGKGAHVSDGIPSRMLEGIKSFVNENTPRALRLTDSETHKKIASFCNYLRASSKKAREPMERQNEQTTSKKRPAGDTTTTVPKKMNKN